MPRTAATLIAYAAQSLNRGQQDSVETCKRIVNLLFPVYYNFKYMLSVILKLFVYIYVAECYLLHIA